MTTFCWRPLSTNKGSRTTLLQQFSRPTSCSETFPPGQLEYWWAVTEAVIDLFELTKWRRESLAGLPHRNLNSTDPGAGFQLDKTLWFITRGCFPSSISSTKTIGVFLVLPYLCLFLYPCGALLFYIIVGLTLT